MTSRDQIHAIFKQNELPVKLADLILTRMYWIHDHSTQEDIDAALLDNWARLASVVSTIDGNVLYVCTDSDDSREILDEMEIERYGDYYTTTIDKHIYIFVGLWLSHPQRDANMLRTENAISNLLSGKDMILMRTEASDIDISKIYSLKELKQICPTIWFWFFYSFDQKEVAGSEVLYRVKQLLYQQRFDTHPLSEQIPNKDRTVWTEVVYGDVDYIAKWKKLRTKRQKKCKGCDVNIALLFDGRVGICTNCQEIEN